MKIYLWVYDKIKEKNYIIFRLVCVSVVGYKLVKQC